MKNLSAFGNSALVLDADFIELNRLAEELSRLEIDSESDFARAKKLLGHFGETGERIGTGVQAMAKELEAARTQAEQAAQIVAMKAAEIQKRQSEESQMNERFNSLGEMIRQVTTSMNQLQSSGAMTEEKKKLLSESLPEMDLRLGMLVDEAQKLRSDAEALRLKSMSNNAYAMAQSLDAARKKLSLYVGQPTLQ